MDRDRRIVLSVAGSGKTSLLIDRLDTNRRFLIVTYTDKNTDNIKRRIVRKFGYQPQNITVYTYFEFLMTVCYRPFFSDRVKARGIDWKMPNPETLKMKRDKRAFYINPNNDLYHNRIALICKRSAEAIAKRIEKYYDCFYYDEAQDLDGHDFDFIREIIPSNVEVIIVGDFFQHTFSTSKDGNTNSTLYDKYERYKGLWKETGLDIDTTSLLKSHRCSASICDFVRNKIGIEIYSANGNVSEIVEVTDENRVENLVADNSIPKLFFQEASRYNCFAINWGESKGLDDFTDVCIVLNKKTLNDYRSDKLQTMAPTSKNKFYVACTRAKRNIYFIPYTLLEKYRKTID